MIFFKEIKNFKLYNKQVLLPLEDKNKRFGSLIYLITPNVEESINIINNKTFVNKYFNAYYIERDVTFLITQESFLAMADTDQVVLEDTSILNEVSQEVVDNSTRHKSILEGLTSVMDEIGMKYSINETSMTITYNDRIESLLESDISNSRYNQILKQILFRERLKTPKDIVPIYDRIKSECKEIKKTFLYLEKYKNYNLFLDFFYYNNSFFKNNTLNNKKGLYLYLELLSRFIIDDRFDSYTTKHVFIPIDGWARALPEGIDITNINESLNPISVLTRLMRYDLQKLKSTFGDFTFVFTNGTTYFKLPMGSLDDKSYLRFNKLINILHKNLPIPSDEQEDLTKGDSPKAIVLDILSRLENGKSKIKINNLTGGDTVDEKELLERIEDAASRSTDTDDALERLDGDPKFKEALLRLSVDQGNGVNINKTRLNRLQNLNNALKDKTINDIKIADLLADDTAEQLPSLDLSDRIDTVNKEEWSNLKYINLEDTYDINKDIVNMINDLQYKSYPIGIRDIKVEDSSTSEDYKETYIVSCEDSFGKRFQFKFDVPKFKDNKFLIVKGNDKTIIGQLFLLPISKTDNDTVQIVSNYNKMFIKRYGQKSDSISDRIEKVIEKIDDIEKTRGNCQLPNREYDIPYTYDNVGKSYTKFETKKYIIYFNQAEIRHKYNITNVKPGTLPIAYDKKAKEVVTTETNKIMPTILTMLTSSSEDFTNAYKASNKGKKYMYSRVSILNAKIPLIVILAYNVGLTEVLKRAGIQYKIVEKLDIDRKSEYDDFIKFEDGYIQFSNTDSASLLLNGLKEMPTDIYSIGDIDSKRMWLEMLDKFGNRAKLSDGLENFYDCMIDHITKQTLMYYQLPTDFTDVMLYANDLLISTKFNAHTNLEGYRYRSNEIVAGYVYKQISRAYIEYKDKVKKGYKEATMSMKQSSVIDELLTATTVGDSSYTTPIGELETLNSVSPKGLSGMNSERAYKVDKRSYDPSMINLIAMATNFAGNSGINRQTTIDMNIDTVRGYIKVDKDRNNMNITKSFSIQEALVPLGSTRNDPSRSAMDFIQTAKHQLRTKVSHPSLITNGADQALPYLITNNFAFKAKQDGFIKEKTDDYVIIQYKDGTYDFVDTRNNIRKNSDGGFYISLKLDCELEVGAKVKKHDIIAYDKLSFNNSFGTNDTLTYSMGLLTKVALMSTDEGFEDSTIISEYLSDALSSEIDIKKEVSMKKDAILLDIAKKGQKVQEGDTILVFQDAYDHEDINILMQSLSDDVDLISDLGRFTIKAKANGWIEDIKVYRTCEEEELSDSLKELFNKVNKPIKKMRSAMKKHGIDYVYGLESTETLPQTGKLKNTQDGVLIEIYLKYEDKMAVGDKIVNYSAIKGVTRTVYQRGQEPYSSYRKDEKIHTLLCVASSLARMASAPIIVGGINKVLIELDRHCKDIAGIPWKYLDQM